jgi:hypothetical protein
MENALRNRVVQAALGAGLISIVFAAGVVVGMVFGHSREGREMSLAPAIPSSIDIHHHGLPSDRVACLEWVSKNFDHPNVGQFGLMCSGGK